MSATGIGATCAVGMFPDGAAQCGAVDMSGNVWEWCRTAWLENYDAYEENVTDEEEGSARRVLRGGSFDLSAGHVRCAYRHPHAPGHWDSPWGFRVVCAPS
ncbi:MAG: SUMF1/EgtB/PvdO family nonheme iron enzyme, partial [Halieaceae bacterium]|nr:SUMF1/EgtB/PvdO family nonheme iron enzyme [Halieaceae bacterium]